MKYAKRNKHKLNKIYEITYLSLTGIHKEFVLCRYVETVKDYANKEAVQNGCVVTDVSLSSLPHNMRIDESFTDLT